VDANTSQSHSYFEVISDRLLELGVFKQYSRRNPSTTARSILTLPCPLRRIRFILISHNPSTTARSILTEKLAQHLNFR